MFGAMSQAVCGWDSLLPGSNLRHDPGDFGPVMRRLMAFVGAGFQAPATQEVHQ
jgi:hypothetical protein